VRPGRLVLAWCASMALLVLEHVGGAWSLAPASLLALAALPWLCLAGLPSEARPRSSQVSRFASIACALPPLALAAAIDLRRGAPLFETALALAVLLALLCLAVAAAGRAAGASYAIAWLVFAPGVPLLAAAIAWGAQAEHARGPRVLELAASASPLGWCCDLARDLVRGEGLPAPWGALAVALALAWLAQRGPETETVT